MPCRLTRAAYQQLVDENIEWLKKQERTLERDHIIQIVKESVDYTYNDHYLENLDLKNHIAELKWKIKELERGLSPELRTT